MKKILTALTVTLSTFLAGTQLALAQATCSLNGKEIPCSEMPQWFWTIIMVMPLVAIAGFIFWLLMLIDAIQNQEENKVMWIILLIFLNFLGAIIYYFSAKRNRKHI
jgi:uncharacterized BrkB/YihY/UPF0761 family membrane protein